MRRSQSDLERLAHGRRSHLPPPRTALGKGHPWTWVSPRIRRRYTILLCEALLQHPLERRSSALARCQGAWRCNEEGAWSVRVQGKRLSRPPRAHRACSAVQLPRRSLTRVPLPACYFGSIDRRPERILLTTAKTFLAVCEYVPRYRPCLTGRSGQRARTSLARSPPSMSRWRRPRRIRLPPSARSRCDICPKRPPP